MKTTCRFGVEVESSASACCWLATTSCYARLVTNQWACVTCEGCVALEGKGGTRSSARSSRHRLCQDPSRLHSAASGSGSNWGLQGSSWGPPKGHSRVETCSSSLSLCSSQGLAQGLAFPAAVDIGSQPVGCTAAVMVSPESQMVLAMGQLWLPWSSVPLWGKEAVGLCPDRKDLGDCLSGGWSPVQCSKVLASGRPGKAVLGFARLAQAEVP